MVGLMRLGLLALCLGSLAEAVPVPDVAGGYIGRDQAAVAHNLDLDILTAVIQDQLEGGDPHPPPVPLPPLNNETGSPKAKPKAPGRSPPAMGPPSHGNGTEPPYPPPRIQTDGPALPQPKPSPKKTPRNQTMERGATAHPRSPRKTPKTAKAGKPGSSGKGMGMGMGKAKSAAKFASTVPIKRRNTSTIEPDVLAAAAVASRKKEQQQQQQQRSSRDEHVFTYDNMVLGMTLMVGMMLVMGLVAAVMRFKRRTEANLGRILDDIDEDQDDVDLLLFGDFGGDGKERGQVSGSLNAIMARDGEAGPLGIIL